MSLLEALLPIIDKSTTKIEISLEGSGEGVLMRVSPVLGHVPENAGEAEKKLRAALSVPLKVVGSINQIEAELVERVSTYQAKRNQWQSEFDAIDTSVEPVKVAPTKAESKPDTTNSAQKTPETVSNTAAVVPEIEDDFEL